MRAVTVVLIGITLIGAIWWQLLCYPISDDYLYRLVPPEDTCDMTAMDEWMPMAGEISSAGDYFRAVEVNFRAYNGRLANFAYMLVSNWPLMMNKLLCGLSIFLMFYLLLRMGLPGKGRLTPWYVALGVALLWIVFPWNDGMQSSAFIFNYVVSSVMLLGFMLLYRRFDSFGPGGKWAMAFFAFAMGWVHEGFAICLGAYLVGYGIVSRSWDRWHWLLLIAGGAGLSLILLSAVHARFDSWTETRELNIYSLRADLVFISGVLFPVFLGILCVWFMFRRFAGDACRIQRAELAGFLLAMTAGICMCLVLGIYRRVRWPADVFVVLILLRGSALWLPGDGRGVGRRVLTGCCALFAALYAVWFGGVLGWQNRIRHLCVEAENMVWPRYSTNSGVLYAPLIAETDVPWFYLGLPYPVYSSYYFSDFFGAYWTGNLDLAFVPEKFKGRSFCELPAVPGNAGVRGEYPWFYIDRKYDGLYEVLGEELDFWEAPGPWAVDKVKGTMLGRTDLVHPLAQLTPVNVNEADTMYRVYFRLPYSFLRRRILRVDTLDMSGE